MIETIFVEDPYFYRLVISLRKKKLFHSFVHCKYAYLLRRHLKIVFTFYTKVSNVTWLLMCEQIDYIAFIKFLWHLFKLVIGFFQKWEHIEQLIFLYQVSEKEGALCNLDSQLTYILHGKFDTCLQFWCASIAFGIIELKSFKYLDSMYLGKVVTKCILLQVNTQKGQENIQNNV